MVISLNKEYSRNMRQNKSHLNCLIDTELRQELKKIAAERNCSITSIVETLVKEYIENYYKQKEEN